jgi:hypothetical protein
VRRLHVPALRRVNLLGLRRRLLNVLACLAITLCAAIIGTCVATWKRPAYVERDLAYYEGPGKQVWQGLDQAYWQGTLIYVHTRRIQWSASGDAALREFYADHPARARWSFGRLSRPSHDIGRLWVLSVWNRLGFYGLKYDVVFSFTTEHHRVIAFPAWLPVVILFPLAVITLYRQWWKPRRRIRHHLCSACGYDIRASQGRCPECGHPIPGPPAASDADG